MAALGRIFVILIAFILVCGHCLAREAGWVPVPQKSDINRKRPVKAKKAAPLPLPAADTVYDNEPPVTEAELDRFVKLLPQFRSWARKNGEEAHPIINPDGKPDFFYSPKAATWVREHAFAPGRFFCVMGRMAAGAVIVEEGNDLKGTRPPDMPAVSPQELELVRQHLKELLAASGAPQPIK